jgi:hypothetical protein
LVGRPEGKGTLIKPRSRNKDNIKVDFKKWVESVDWVDVIGTGGGRL